MSTSHRVCDSVLRDRRFGVRPEADGQPAEPDALDLSFLGMNPPDHARLRRLAMLAFGPKAAAGYAGRIERVTADLLDAASVAGRWISPATAWFSAAPWTASGRCGMPGS